MCATYQRNCKKSSRRFQIENEGRTESLSVISRRSFLALWALAAADCADRLRQLFNSTASSTARHPAHGYPPARSWGDVEADHVGRRRSDHAARKLADAALSSRMRTRQRDHLRSACRSESSAKDTVHLADQVCRRRFRPTADERPAEQAGECQCATEVLLNPDDVRRAASHAAPALWSAATMKRQALRLPHDRR